jgi:multidrug efflux pump subunit AcrB
VRKSPCRLRFYGSDSRKLLEITTDFMAKMRTRCKGAVDVGYSELDPQNELQIELDRGLANQMGISVNDAAQALRVAFAGVEVGDWVDPTGETRDVSVRLHPGATVSTPATSSACRSPSAAPTAWCRWSRSPPSPWARARVASSTPTASA